jgi:hypothetical protein
MPNITKKGWSPQNSIAIAYAVIADSVKKADGSKGMPYTRGGVRRIATYSPGILDLNEANNKQLTDRAKIVYANAERIMYKIPKTLSSKERKFLELSAELIAILNRREVYEDDILPSKKVKNLERRIANLGNTLPGNSRVIADHLGIAERYGINPLVDVGQQTLF